MLMTLLMEVYPSLAEGNGLENHQVGKPARGFKSPCLLTFLLICYDLLIVKQNNIEDNYGCF